MPYLGVPTCTCNHTPAPACPLRREWVSAHCDQPAAHVIVCGGGSGACGGDVRGQICHTHAFPRVAAPPHLQPPAPPAPGERLVVARSPAGSVSMPSIPSTKPETLTPDP